jgi:DNA-binding SARP family transcriptional activator
VDFQRRILGDRLVRGLEVATDVWIKLEDAAQAVVAARQLVDADPFRETSHERLIRAQVLAGNRAEALLAYSDCERRLREELGVEPSSQIQAAYEEALRVGTG